MLQPSGDALKTESINRVCELPATKTYTLYFYCENCRDIAAAPPGCGIGGSPVNRRLVCGFSIPLAISTNLHQVFCRLCTGLLVR